MLDKNELWDRVKQLKGQTLYTYTDLQPNTIIEVEDIGSSQDAVIFKDRETRPIREDIIAAYKLLYKQGELERGRDLAWLVGPEKKTSSIIFRIIGEVARDKIELIQAKNRKILRLKK